MLGATALTERFDRALLYATHVHGGQVRKGTSIPYVAHLLAVAATVLEYSGSEDMGTGTSDEGARTRLLLRKRSRSGWLKERAIRKSERHERNLSVQPQSGAAPRRRARRTVPSRC
jgi:hypothetical protein